LPLFAGDLTLRGNLTIDVAVVGGGIQALLVLRKLAERYSTAMFTRSNLGAGQTAHSHAFLHQGQMVARMPELLKKLQAAKEDWDDLVPKELLHETSFYWTPKEIPFDCPWNGLVPSNASVPFRVRRPAALYEFPGHYINAHDVVSHIGAPLLSQIRRIYQIDQLGVSPNNEITFRIAADSDRTAGYRVTAKAVVFAAGAGNHRLISELTKELGYRGQQTIKAFMLIIQGKEGNALNRGQLPHHSGFFPSERIFIAPRRHNGESVWLVGDGQRFWIQHPADWLHMSARDWFRRLRVPLFDLVPELATYGKEFAWGYYEAVKAEGDHDGGFPENSPTIELLGNLPAIAVWPGLFTLAPSAACKVATQTEALIGSQVRTPAPVWPADLHPPVIERETWLDTPLWSWSEFNHLLNGSGALAS